MKKAFFFDGPRDSGKSVAGNLMEKLIGREYCAHKTLHDLGRPFKVSDFTHKFLNVGGETKATKLDDASVFKTLTSGGIDVISADRKHQTDVNFRNTAMLVFLMNKPPKLSFHEDAESVLGRIQIVPFLNQVSECDKDYELEAKLEAELPGIAHFAMQGLQRLVRNGYPFSKCEESLAKFDEYADVLSKVEAKELFCEQCLELDVRSYLTTNDLNMAFRSFCVSQDLIENTPKSWKKTLENFGYNISNDRHRINGEQQRFIIGIRFNDYGLGLLNEND